MPAFFAPTARLAHGWATQVRIEVDERGRIASVHAGADAAGAERLSGPIIPAIANLHSHAFQRALAGLGEKRGAAEIQVTEPNATHGAFSDDFWSWREVMYRFLDRLNPEQVRIIATQLYIEMVEAGYSHVCEFHYLHRPPDGSSYQDPSCMADAHLAAARESGIGLTLAPSLYTYGNFGAAPPTHGQRRFILDTEAYLELLSKLERDCREQQDFDLAVCFHSLRAVTPQQIERVMACTPHSLPIYIHVAEQTKEVDDCLAWSGCRPVQWLLHNVDLDERWHMVHATHMTDAEVDAAARSQALAVLCPTTEANLGDGFFPADRWLAAGGRFGIGSDSNVTIDPCEELRLFEYARRLLHRRRSLAATESQPFPGARLWLDAASAMVPRSQQPGIGAIAPGMRADFLVLNAEHINLAGRSGDALFDALVFVSTPGASAIAENWIAGRRITQQGRHPKAEHARAAYARVLRELRSD